jgi:hypothetical protein
MLRALGRILLVPIAFLLAAVVTLCVVFSLGQETVVKAISARAPDNEALLGQILDLVGIALRFASLNTLIPAVLVVMVGEIARIRSSLYYIVGGGLALAVVPLLTRFAEPTAALELSPTVLQVLAVAGFAGGLVYWVLAGRNA